MLREARMAILIYCKEENLFGVQKQIACDELVRFEKLKCQIEIKVLTDSRLFDSSRTFLNY